MVSVCPDLDEARALLAEALEYYDGPEGQRDIHRFTAMAARAELAFRAGDYAAAGDGFAETAAAWEAAGLAPQRLRVLLGNAEMCYERSENGEKAAEMRRKKEASGL